MFNIIMLVLSGVSATFTCQCYGDDAGNATWTNTAGALEDGADYTIINTPYNTTSFITLSTLKIIETSISSIYTCAFTYQEEPATVQEKLQVVVLG